MRKHLDYIYKRNLRTSRREESGQVTIETDTKSQYYDMNQPHNNILQRDNSAYFIDRDSSQLNIAYDVPGNFTTFDKN